MHIRKCIHGTRGGWKRRRIHFQQLKLKLLLILPLGLLTLVVLLYRHYSRSICKLVEAVNYTKIQYTSRIETI